MKTTDRGKRADGLKLSDRIAMPDRMKRWIAAAATGAFVLVASACAGGSMQEGASGSRVASSAEQGAAIWRTTCYRCHNRRPATEFSAEEWPVLVDHMRTRAHLTRAEADAVTAFLQELAESS